MLAARVRLDLCVGAEEMRLDSEREPFCAYKLLQIRRDVFHDCGADAVVDVRHDPRQWRGRHVASDELLRSRISETRADGSCTPRVRAVVPARAFVIRLGR